MLPPALDKRPKFRGFPVPYLVEYHRGPNGTQIPDFKTPDADRWVECTTLRKCALCGEEMGGLLAWIGGNACRDSRFFSDPAMHDACARAATKICPFIMGTKDYALITKRLSEEEGMHVAPGLTINTVDRPKRMYLMLSRDYQIIKTPTAVFVKSSPFISVERIPEVC